MTKIENFLTKYLNVICYGFCIIFLLSSILVCFSNYSKELQFQKNINAMIEYCNSRNAEIQNGKNDNVVDNESETIDQLYFDGKTALIQSYNNLIQNASSFNIEGSGLIKVSTIGGLYANVQMDVYINKFSNTKIYEEILTKVKETNAGAITNRINTAMKRLHHYDTKSIYISNKVRFENTKLVADYENAQFVQRQEELFLYDNLYIINEETVKEIKFFKVNKKNDKVKNYYVQALLDPVNSTKKYSLALQQQVWTTVPPVFKQVLITVIIDSKGNLVSINASDKFVIDLIGINSDSESSLTCSITQINEEIKKEITDF